MKSPLFSKVFVPYLIIMILSVSVVTILVSVEVKKSTTARIEEELTAYGGIIDLSARKEIEKNIDRLADTSRSRVTLISTEGKVIADSERSASEMESHLNRPEIQEARLKGKGSAIRYSHTLAVDMLYVAIPVMDGSHLSGYIRLARPLYDVKHSTEKIYRSFFTAILVVVPLSLIIAIFFSYRLTAPILAMEQFTENLRKGVIHETLTVKTSGELQQLADNINYLVTELQDKIRIAVEEKGKLAAAFASMVEGLLILDQEGRIEVFNRAFREMIASQYGDVAGKTIIEAFRNINLQRIYERFKEVNRPVTEEVILGIENPITLEVSLTAIPGSSGEGKVLVVFHDVTRIKKLEKMRADFVANVTHEIKTPLTAILGFVETLQDGDIADTQTADKFLNIIERHARRLDRLVEDLLTISNIELGEMKFFFEGLSLAEIVENVLPIIQVRAIEKNISIVEELPNDLPPIRADRDRLIQVLLNVLDNAVKFTPPSGKVTLMASAEKDQYIVIRISDTGIGIPKEEIPRLGERFYRIDKTRSRELGGTGLGLSIVKHLLMAHGGRMEIESQLGRGTCISLFFPISRQSSV